MPSAEERESSESSANLCLRLFSDLEMKDISIQDIDIAHRVSARQTSNRPNAIICRFTRRLAKDKVMAARRNAVNLQASDLGLPSHTSMEHVGLYEHLTPRMQSLFYEANCYFLQTLYKRYNLLTSLIISTLIFFFLFCNHYYL